MLLYVCERCKFSSPKSALCHTCGAKLKKESPSREVLYRVQDLHEDSFAARTADVAESAETWFVQLWSQLMKKKEELSKPVGPPLPPKKTAHS
jgi:hypothetical protein